MRRADVPTAAQRRLLAAVREGERPWGRDSLGSRTSAICHDRGWLAQGAVLTEEGRAALARFEAAAAHARFLARAAGGAE